MAGNSDDPFGVPEDFIRAIAVVRAMWNNDDVPERALAWAMVVEAVNRLAALNGPVSTSRLLARLGEAVGETSTPSSLTLQ
ncbi:hypothetical protein A6A40_21600 (plasmid) [Azospirillum humicireducens]|uniref:Uncharacterized protein n=1 Tax=Azospirillum humicireducens TaxID=1226968 RepID=A0A2R4VT35_9PROT|nr:hypothetical protein [Azospirillum humicireducens]AWB07595.1 hypothetical protein A6A40_21600 [Azospirillum humicireducens]